MLDDRYVLTADEVAALPQGTLPVVLDRRLGQDQHDFRYRLLKLVLERSGTPFALGFSAAVQPQDEAIAALARGAAPPFAPTSRDAAVHASTVDLLRNRGLSRSESALALLGAEGVASLVQLVGRQSSSALTLSVFDASPEQPWEADAALLTDWATVL